jgi:hypothetical protein
MNLDELFLNKKNDYITIKYIPTTYCLFCNEIETNFVCCKCGIDDNKDMLVKEINEISNSSYINNIIIKEQEQIKNNEKIILYKNFINNSNKIKNDIFEFQTKINEFNAINHSLYNLLTNNEHLIKKRRRRSKML